MRILMTNNGLMNRGGSELYTRDIATQMRKFGHQVVVYSPTLGQVAEEIRNIGIPVIDDLEALTVPPDLIHGQHHLDAAAAALMFPNAPMVYVCHGWLPWQEMPLTYPLADRYIAVSNLTRESLITSAIPSELVTVVPNFVDTTRFHPRPKKSKHSNLRALAYGNPWHPDSTALKIISDCCRDKQIEFDAIGLGMKKSITNPEEVLHEYDIVFAMGKCAIEALASGCAVIVADPKGFGGNITTASLPTQKDMNFGLGTVAGNPVTYSLICDAIEKINPKESEELRQEVISTMGLEFAAKKIEEIYQRVIKKKSLRANNLSRSTSVYLQKIKRHIIKIEIDSKAAAESFQTEIEKLNHILEEKEKLIASLQSQASHLREIISDQNNCISSIQGSRSWKITYPLRLINRILKRQK